MSRSRHRRQSRGRWLVAVAGALAVLVLVVAMAWADRGPAREGSASGGTDDPGSATTTGDDAATPDPIGTPTAEDGSASGTASSDAPELELRAGVTESRRLAAVPLRGTYRPGASLRVQLEDDGTWSSFPLSVVVEDDGAFATYVELGSTGANRLRMVEPATGTTSEEVVVTVH